MGVEVTVDTEELRPEDRTVIPLDEEATVEQLRPSRVMLIDSKDACGTCSGRITTFK